MKYARRRMSASEGPCGAAGCERRLLGAFLALVPDAFFFAGRFAAVERVARFFATLAADSTAGAGEETGLSEVSDADAACDWFLDFLGTVFVKF
jgi:hypothetical protein